MFYYIDFSKYEIVKSEVRLDTSLAANNSLLACCDESMAKKLLYDSIKSDMMTKIEYFVDKFVKLELG